MSEIAEKKDTAWSRWYKTHKQELANKRKLMYETDPEYREKALAQAKDWRSRQPKKQPKKIIPPEYVYTFADASTELDVDNSTLREWMSKEYFPRPAQFGTAFRFTAVQVLVLKEIKKFFDQYGSRQAAQMDQFESLKVLVRANW